MAAGGAASDYMRPDADVAIVPDGKGWNGDMEEAAADNPSLRYSKKVLFRVRLGQSTKNLPHSVLDNSPRNHIKSCTLHSLVRL